jgi:hypothetical protein
MAWRQVRGPEAVGLEQIGTEGDDDTEPDFSGLRGSGGLSDSGGGERGVWTTKLAKVHQPYEILSRSSQFRRPSLCFVSFVVQTLPALAETATVRAVWEGTADGRRMVE